MDSDAPARCASTELGSPAIESIKRALMSLEFRPSATGEDTEEGHAPGKRKEGLLDIDVGLGRGLEVAKSQLVRELLALLRLDHLHDRQTGPTAGREGSAGDGSAPSCRSNRTCCQ